MADRGVSLSLASVPRAVRQRYEQRSDRLTRTRSVRDALLSLAGLVGRPVLNQAGEQIGRLVDLVARWDGQEVYPPVTGLVVQVGGRRAWVPSEAVDHVGRDSVRLRSARLDLREFTERPGEVLLAADVLDHQLVDIEGVRVVRPSDLYLTPVEGRLRLVGMDTGFGALARRLGPARWRSRATAEQVIDWSDVQAFGTGAGSGAVQLAAPRGELRRLHPAELADLLEDLGRAERKELLDLVSPEAAADALEEMRADELEELLSESDPGEAAGLIARMEPDEAADALRELEDDERDELLDALPTPAAEDLAGLLEHDPRSAGALMTPAVISVPASATVGSVRDRMRQQADHDVDLDGVVVVDDDGRLVDDVTVLELFLADPDTQVAALVGPPWPVVVTPNDPIDQVVDQLIDSRRTSVVVVDEDTRPIGRIMADDVIDALVSDRGRFRFPRLLS